ncbi:transmembrane protein, putative [Medicago truncatula]|uniref:Transmembrane protein, putative n=2 Tax=Medicago truncatula TaxID=3880 RepID=G7IDP9_MEDTR|nr:transmembrane protein, putative [Medicago truncatula]
MTFDVVWMGARNCFRVQARLSSKCTARATACKFTAANPNPSFKEVMFYLFEVFSSENEEVLLVFIWSIWKSRSATTWEIKRIDQLNLFIAAECLLEELLQACDTCLHWTSSSKIVIRKTHLILELLIALSLATFLISRFIFTSHFNNLM